MDFTTDPALIVERIQPFVTADPVLATTLGTIQTLLRDPPSDAAPWCAWAPGAIAARSQRNTPVTLLGDWPDLAPLADALLGLRPDAVNGPQHLVDGIVSTLGERGVGQRHRIDERLFRLDTLTRPVGVPGSPRRATAADTELLLQWWGAFAAEAHDPAKPHEIDSTVDRALRTGRQWLWCLDGAEPVSMAAGRAPVAGCGRVGPVYTPPALRGRGYASAVTATVTQEILDDCAIPALFTDRSNPTSNKIYQQLGYRPVSDCAFVSFDWASGNNVAVTATGRASGSPGSSIG